MAALQRPASPPEHTVGLTLNAKGDVQIEVTARGHDLDQLVTDVVASFDLLVQRYPRGDTPPAKTPADRTAAAAAAIARSKAGGRGRGMAR